MIDQITPEQLSMLKTDLRHLQERLLDLSQQAQRISAFIAQIASAAENPAPSVAPEPLQPNSQQQRLETITIANPWTFRRPVVMRLGQTAQPVSVRSWRDVFRILLAMIYDKNPRELKAFILQRAATNRNGYGTTPDGMQSPHEITPGLWINLGLSANAVRNEIRDLIRFAGGMDAHALQIEVENDLEDDLPPASNQSSTKEVLPGLIQ